MATTAPLTSGLSDALSKDLNTKFFFGALSLEEQVAALDPTAWFDNTFAKSKVSVRTNGTNEYFTGGNIIEADGTDKAFSLSFVADYTSGGAAWLFNTNGNPFINVIFSSGSTIFFDIQGGAGQMRVSSSVSGSGFKFITLTYDGSASNTGMKIYIDGVESTTLGTDNYSGPLPDDGVTISAFDGGSNFFGGDIDQCIGFNKELTATEVSEIVNSGNGLNWKDLTTEETFYDDIVTWYDFNAPSDFGKDASPNNLDLTLISIDSTNAVEGHISGKAGDWDGVNLWTDRSSYGNDATQTTLSSTPFIGADLLNGEGVVDFGDGTSSTFLTPPTALSQDGNPLTNPMSIWVLFNCRDISPRQDFYYNNGYRLFFDGGAQIRFEMYDTVGAQLRRSTVNPTNFFNDEWTLIGVTYDGTHATNGRSSISLYKNGVLANMNANTASTLSGNYRNAGTRYFGAGSGQYRGLIADSSVYIGKALSASDHKLIKDYLNEEYNLSL